MSRPKSSEDEHVLETARSVFAARGYRASTRQIAAEVELSQPGLIQRFGSKRDLFLAAMMPEPLNIGWIIKGDSKAAGADDQALTGIAERLYAQIRERAPRILLLEQSSDIDASDIEEAHARIGVPDLIDALAARIESLSANNDAGQTHSVQQTVEALLLAAHGATRIGEAGHTGVEFSRLEIEGQPQQPHRPVPQWGQFSRLEIEGQPQRSGFQSDPGR